MEVSSGAGELTGCAEPVVECRLRNALGVVCRLGGGSNEAADLAGRGAATVPRSTVAKVLLNFARLGSLRAVVSTVPTGIAVKGLMALFGAARNGKRDRE